MRSSILENAHGIVFDTLSRACPHFKNGDKNEINCRQTRKIAPLISRYW